jgi:hypothetical protein
MRSQLAEVVTGLRTPLSVLGRAGQAGRLYAKVVVRQLLLVALVIAVAAPNLLTALVAGATGRGAATLPDTDADGELFGRAWIEAHAPGLLSTWMALAALYAAWTLAELFIYALHREHIDQLTDALARAVGLPGHEGPRTAQPPRMRFDPRWALRRTGRQVVALLVFASGAPFFLLARIVPGVGPKLYLIILGAWGAYWVVVTTAGKSDAAWSGPTTRDPWFRRTWSFCTTHVPGFRWALPRMYGRLWRRVTCPLDRAAEIAEARPWAFVGLSLVRLAGNLPIISILVRPLLPIAATLLSASPVYAPERPRGQLRPAWPAPGPAPSSLGSLRSR